MLIFCGVDPMFRACFETQAAIFAGFRGGVYHHNLHNVWWHRETKDGRFVCRHVLYIRHAVTTSLEMIPGASIMASQPTPPK